MLLILGRTASGKDTLAGILETAYGMSQVISATTRPRRFAGEATHRFVTPEQAAAETDKVAQTTIGEHLYYATREDIEGADVYIIDPAGMMELAAAMPEERFQPIVVGADVNHRAAAFVARAMEGDPGLDEDAAWDAFEERDRAEDARFCALEGSWDGTRFVKPDGCPDNLAAPILVRNPMTDLPELEHALAHALFEENRRQVLNALAEGMMEKPSAGDEELAAMMNAKRASEMRRIFGLQG